MRVDVAKIGHPMVEGELMALQLTGFIPTAFCQMSIAATT